MPSREAGIAEAWRLAGDCDFEIRLSCAERITSVVEQECAAHDVPVPRLTVEPGRAIARPAGVTLYRVLTVKHGARTFVVVDGGMSDNPRPALYGSRYHIERAGTHTAARRNPTRSGAAVPASTRREDEGTDYPPPDAPAPEDHQGEAHPRGPAMMSGV